MESWEHAADAELLLGARTHAEPFGVQHGERRLIALARQSISFERGTDRRGR
jgi:hypothetical protein